MTLKGDYDPNVTYSAGDVVRYQDAGYVAKEEVSDIPPTVDRVWRRLGQELWDVVDMILDAMDNAMAVINSRITEESIALKTDTADYIITVDDSGETPELEVTAIEEEEEAES